MVDVIVVGHKVVSLVVSAAELVAVVLPEVVLKFVVTLDTTSLVGRVVTGVWVTVDSLKVLVVAGIGEYGSPLMVELTHLEVIRLVVCCALVSLHKVDVDGT